MEDLLKLNRLADICFENGNISEAFNYYLTCLEHSRDFKPILKEKFETTLCMYGELLEKDNKIDELFDCYRKALNIFDDSFEIQCNLGAHLCRLGFNLNAYCYFFNILKQNDSFVPAFRNLENVSSCILERWHYRMLNDNYRNETYREAVVKKILQNFVTVLDIGTGSGLLSIYAVQCNPVAVYACDYNKDVISLARDILNKNKLTDRIVLINKISNDLEIPVDIPNRVSLVVTETMDCALLGENLLQTLIHAWENLLLPPVEQISRAGFNDPIPYIENDGKHGVVIPFGGVLYVAAVECNSFARRYYYPLNGGSNDVGWIDRIRNITLNSDDDSTFTAAYKTLPSDRNYYGKPDRRYYDSSYSRPSNVRFLSEPYRLFDINFNDIQDLKDNLNGAKTGKIFKLNFKTTGYLHAIAAWFEVRIDENTFLTSSPYPVNSNHNYNNRPRRICCWEQAMFPLHRLIHVQSEYQLIMEANWSDGRIGINVVDWEYYPHFSLPCNVISVLNDLDLMRHCDDVVANFIRRSTGKYVVNDDKNSIVKILDLYPFPLFGLNILRARHLLSDRGPVRLICVRSDEHVENFVVNYVRTNKIPDDCVEFISEYEYDRLCSIGRPVFDAIITNLINEHGDLNEYAVMRTSVLRELLKDGGVFYPEDIIVYCQLAESEWLRNTSSINNPDIADLHIASILNQFKVSHHLELDLLSVDFKPISQIFSFRGITTNDARKTFEDKSLVQVNCNASLTAVCYWFGVNYAGYTYHTMNDTSYVHQAAFILDEDLPVYTDSVALVRFCYYKGMLRIMVDGIN